MIPAAQLLSALPTSLRDPLIEEFNSIVRNYMERRWSPSELSGGKFCEIVYTILEGCASGTYPPRPHKPRDFVTACRTLESRATTARSFQILIPRLLPALYEIRNNRGVGHVGGDVDPNHMDASAVVAMASWVIAELVRVFHGVSVAEAQTAVEILTERRHPIVWSDGSIRRVLKLGLSLKDEILLLIASCSGDVNVDDLFRWTDYKNRSHFNRSLRDLHKKRFLELNEDAGFLKLLPPGAEYVTNLIQKLS